MPCSEIRCGAFFCLPDVILFTTVKRVKWNFSFGFECSPFRTVQAGGKPECGLPPATLYPCQVASGLNEMRTTRSPERNGNTILIFIEREKFSRS